MQVLGMAVALGRAGVGDSLRQTSPLDIDWLALCEERGRNSTLSDLREEGEGARLQGAQRPEKGGQGGQGTGVPRGHSEGGF